MTDTNSAFHADAATASPLGDEVSPAPAPSTSEQEWAILEELAAKQATTSALVVRLNGDGLDVTVNGVPGFLPARDTDSALQWKTYVGRSLRVQLHVDKRTTRKGDVVRSLFVSQTAANYEFIRGYLQNVKVGETLSGTVAAIVYEKASDVKPGQQPRELGATLLIDGVVLGFVHWKQVSRMRRAQPSAFLSVGAKVEAVVLECIPKECRLRLSTKKFFGKPGRSKRKATA